MSCDQTLDKLSEKLKSKLLVQEEHGFQKGHHVPPGRRSSKKPCLDRVNPDQEKYQMQADFFDAIKEESGEEILEIRNPEDVIPVEELDNKDEKVIVFDDIQIDKKNMDRIKEYFLLSRNKNCC